MIASWGRAFLTWVRSTGTLALVLFRIVQKLPHMERQELARALVLFGYRSLPLCLVVATLTGATVVLQTALYVQRFGARTHLGWAAGYAVLWEFGPLLLGLLMAARVGARNAAELALLKVGGQLEGLEGISLDPFALLVAPRAAAIAVSLACLAGLSFAIAIVWEAGAALLTLGIPVRVFVGSFSTMLGTSDFLGGLAKAFVFGVAIALVSTVVGLSAHGGARGVGRAAAASVVYSCAAIFSLDFVLTSLLASVL